VFLEEMKITEAELAAVERVTILACGTSWHAALVGKFLLEKLARVPVEVDYGSEYRYPQSDRHFENAGDRHHAVRRNRRYAGGAPRGEA
jgi:glucosamine--fructose-6-phosphate aminotransferase (isomerizing)